MPRFLDPRSIRKLAQRAVQFGALVHSPYRVEWDISGFCRESRVRELVGRYESDHPLRGVPDIDTRPMTVVLRVRCNRCEACLSLRRSRWRERIRFEMLNGERTWFVTLTKPYEAHAQAVLRLRYALAKRSVAWDYLVTRGQHETDDAYQRRVSEAQFGLLCRDFGNDVTLWLKRLRAQTKVPFRYCLIFEKHTAGGANQGMPHAHLLVTETDKILLLRKRQLQGQWPHGFSTCKLADPETAEYVTKYLTKHAPVRIRASVRYGLSKRSPIIASRVGRKATPRGVAPPKGYDLPPFGEATPKGVDDPFGGAVT